MATATITIRATDPTIAPAYKAVGSEVGVVSFMEDNDIVAAPVNSGNKSSPVPAEPKKHVAVHIDFTSHLTHRKISFQC